MTQDEPVLSEVNGSRVDPITLEVVRNALVALVVEMTDNLVRTAYSPIAAEIKDFSISLLDGRGDLIAQAPNGVPMFCADLSSPIRKALELYRDEGFAAGDVLLSSDTETNGQHVNNVVVFSPIFAGTHLVAFAAVRSHWMDVGGSEVGSLSTGALDIFSEGIQYPFLKVYRAGVPDQSIIRLIRTNTRFPELVLGDMRAQISACKLGERRFLELIERYGIDSIVGSIERMWDEAEIVARKAVELIPDGTYEAECVLDNDGITIDQPIPLKVRLIVSGSDMTFDFSETSPQVQGPYNSRASDTIARVAFKYVSTPDLATNEGAFRNLHVVCPEGSILSADPRAPMGWFNMAVLSTIDLVLKALQPALPKRITAGNSDNIGFGQFVGMDPQSGRSFQTFVPYLGGWGARPNGDGTNAVVSLVQGDVRFMPIEVQEVAYPIRAREFALRADSGGAGTYRGGLGVVLACEALTDCSYRGFYERTIAAPWGFDGGHDGKITSARIASQNGESVEPPLKCNGFPLRKGDVVRAYSAGGGGIGDAFKRDPSAVREDVQQGYVSIAAARDEYGVIIDPETGEVAAFSSSRNGEITSS